MGIKTIMVTGDNPLTARQSPPRPALTTSWPRPPLKASSRRSASSSVRAPGRHDRRRHQRRARSGPGDVAVAMNTGTQAAKEAGNMVDLDSSPTKLIEVVRIGKQLLMTRGSLTTFSVANDMAKYFAIIPALFSPIYPGLDASTSSVWQARCPRFFRPSSITRSLSSR
ncbi:MAG: hypothetical protein ACLTYW_04255 [Collinsella sp.]